MRGRSTSDLRENWGLRVRKFADLESFSSFFPL